MNASVRGTSHVATDQLCQDTCVAEAIDTESGESILVIAASDGAGSATLSHIGADIACTTAIGVVERFAKVQSLDVSRFDAYALLEEVRDAINQRAAAEVVSSRELACTFMLAIVSNAHVLYAQIGDGAIVVREGDNRRVVFWPDSGEYANMTRFVTDEDAADHYRVEVFETAPEEVAVFTDGLQRLALHYGTKTPHEPFFIPLFATLRSTTDGRDKLASKLEAWLGSESVNERTDDDKTLVLAVRSETRVP